jgi:hypothetical protein
LSLRPLATNSICVVVESFIDRYRILTPKLWNSPTRSLKSGSAVCPRRHWLMAASLYSGNRPAVDAPGQGHTGSRGPAASASGRPARSSPSPDTAATPSSGRPHRRIRTSSSGAAQQKEAISGCSYRFGAWSAGFAARRLIRANRSSTPGRGKPGGALCPAVVLRSSRPGAPASNSRCRLTGSITRTRPTLSTRERLFIWSRPPSVPASPPPDATCTPGLTTAPAGSSGDAGFFLGYLLNYQ